jgi:hypothetical protein
LPAGDSALRDAHDPVHTAELAVAAAAARIDVLEERIPVQHHIHGPRCFMSPCIGDASGSSWSRPIAGDCSDVVALS